jgi:putative membrane protein
MRYLPATTIALSLALTACGSDGGWFGSKSPHASSQAARSAPSSQQQARSVSGAADGIGATGMSAASSPLTAAEQGFIIDAAQGGTAEVALGRLAEQKAANQRVRDFGRRMVEDHTRANQELMGIAQRLGVTPPTALPPAAQAAQMKLQQATGADFDRQYLEQQTAAHDAQRSMFQFASSNAKDPELRAFARRTLPVIERHLAMLRQMTPVAMRTAP